MSEHRPKLVALLTLAWCFVIITGCGAGNSSSAGKGDPAAVPAPPADLAATAGNAMVTLTWTASSGATAYNVKRATSSSGPYTQLAAPTSPAYTDSSVTNGTAYFYVVSALDSAGESANSAQASATPAVPIVPPAAPTNLTATAGNAQASLTWTASSGATSYNVKRSTTSGGPYTQLAAATSPSYTDTTVSNGIAYYYVVTAVNSSGESADSAEASATPDPTISIPATPTGLQATAGNAQVSLTWSASSAATSYNVKRSTTSGGSYTQVGAPASPSFTDASVTNGTTYYYVVSAVDTAGESANSAQVSALPAPAVSIPSVPAGLSANPGNAQVILSWSASNGASSYHVKRSTTSGGTYTQLAAPSSATYTDTSVTNGSTYFYVVSALDSAGESANSAQVSATPLVPTTSNQCGMQLGTSAVIFCDTFDAPAGTGTRSGDLNGDVWGVSRTMGDDGLNFGQHEFNQWNATTIVNCDGTTPTVNAPHDVIICNGQLREASNDNNTGVYEEGDVLTLSMYPKQPFDFAGRTGTVSFDVSNDSTGIHSVWPEFWLSDLPVPAPFSHFGTWVALPANGFAIRMGSVATPGQWGQCQNGNNLTKSRWTVDSVAAVRNYVLDDTNGDGTRTNMTLTPLDCVISSSGPGNMNHVEIRVSQNQVDVYATDAGVAATSTTLRHIATVSNPNLSLTSGLIWLEDVHYNADKQTYFSGTSPSTTQRQHTFSWDNVAFDGPFTHRDFAYDAPDNTLAGANGSFNLGQFSDVNQTSSWSVPNVPANPQAAAAHVLFSFNGEGNAGSSVVLNVVVNCNAHSVPWPYPDQIGYTWRTYAVTIPLTDLVAGTNVVQLGANAQEVFSNVDIVLGDVAGGVPVLPGANDAYP